VTTLPPLEDPNIKTPSYLQGGRTNQKERTRQALLRAALELVDEGRIPSIAQAATRALVSEATAYRYYPEASSLLRDALAAAWPAADDIVAQIRGEADAGERARIAGEAMARHVLTQERQIRALIAAEYASSASASVRPAFRFRFIEAIIEPLRPRVAEPDLQRLERSLAMVISAEACLTLKDFSKATDEQIIETAGWTASQLVSPFGDGNGEHDAD